MIKLLKRAFKRRLSGKFSKKKFCFFVEKLKSLISVRLGKNSHYSEDDYRNAFLYSSLRKGTAEETGNVLSAKGYDVPSGDRQIEVIKQLTLKEIDLMAENMMDLVFKETRKFGVFRFPVNIATDPQNIPYYGDPSSPFVIGTKHERGTHWAHSFVCVDAVVKGKRFTLWCGKRTMKSKNIDLVAKGLKTAKNRAKIDISLLDREFYSVDIVNLHKKNGLNFIIPAVNTDKIKYEKEKARTCSTDYRVRYFYFVLSVVMYNLWVLLNFLITIDFYGFPSKPLVRVYELKIFLETHVENALSYAVGNEPLSFGYVEFSVFNIISLVLC